MAREGVEVRATKAKLLSKLNTLGCLANKKAQMILYEVAHEAKYPAEVARRLNLQRQEVYYYIKALHTAGIIEVKGQRSIRGGRGTLYGAASKAFVVALPDAKYHDISIGVAPGKLASFLAPFIRTGVFEGRIVTGSPEPHGPNRTVGRDGHHGANLG